MKNIELRSKGRVFHSVQEYFDFITHELGYPPLYKHFTEDWVESDGRRLHLDIYEVSRSAPTIVFVPGTAIYALCYGEFLYKLGTSGYNIVGLDPRGHGRSEGTRGDYSIPELMTDIANTITYAISRFNEEVSLAGSSQGGILAFYMAARDERLKSVICQNIADLTAPETLKLVKYPGITRLLKPLFMNLGWEKSQVPVTSYIDLDKIKVRYFGTAKNFIETDPLVIKSISLRALRSLASTPLPVPIEEIKVPVMVISGTADHIFPVSYTRWLFEKLTCKKRLQLYDGLDHAMLHENVDTVLPPVLEWLEQIHPNGTAGSKESV
ncbi:MAG TPA: alpha/beta fold hydrolase [Chitinophagales bacterium]|nr:alpha/beta fold hydrolase [Chitinophagales bacterium]